MCSRKSGNTLNLLKPTGHVMHQQFNIQQLYVLPTLYLSENKQRLVTEMESVYWAVRTGSLNKAVCASYLKGKCAYLRMYLRHNCWTVISDDASNLTKNITQVMWWIFTEICALDCKCELFIFLNLWTRNFYEPGWYICILLNKRWKLTLKIQWNIKPIHCL
jgi:hypothetical protein